MSFIIAEIGVNWDGDYELVKKLIRMAKTTGCDAVKFQSFNEEIVKGHPESNRLMKSSISIENIEEIDKLAKSIGIEWFCTPMYLEAIDLLEPYVKRFKIRELDGRALIDNKKTTLFEKILDTKKEIIVSSNKSPRSSKFFNHPNLKWLYCVPKYPCNLEDLDFSNLCDFNGYSNHSNKIIAPITAAILGAKIIEIHITTDKMKDYADNNVSFEEFELKEIVDKIRLSEIIKK
jgi:sialic acid synthase SpsE